MLVSRGNSRLWVEISRDLLFLALCELVRVTLPTNAKMFALPTYGTNAYPFICRTDVFGTEVAKAETTGCFQSERSNSWYLQPNDKFGKQQVSRDEGTSKVGSHIFEQGKEH